MTNESKEGELTPEQSALAKKFFVALGFLGIAVTVVGLDSFLPVQYVVLLLLIVGLSVVALSYRKNSRRLNTSSPK